MNCPTCGAEIPENEIEQPSDVKVTNRCPKCGKRYETQKTPEWKITSIGIPQAPGHAMLEIYHEKCKMHAHVHAIEGIEFECSCKDKFENYTRFRLVSIIPLEIVKC